MMVSLTEIKLASIVIHARSFFPQMGEKPTRKL